jgi:hypothetical protein
MVTFSPGAYAAPEFQGIRHSTGRQALHPALMTQAAMLGERETAHRPMLD